jgi:hypothetical protein
MAEFIIKIDNWYLRWSNKTDAPVGRGMTLDALKKHWVTYHGKHKLAELQEMLRRVSQTGCSSFCETARELLDCNRAGSNGEKLRDWEIVKKYCEKRGK